MRSSTGGEETATEIEIATETGTSVVGEWTTTRAVMIRAVIEILGIEVEVDRETNIIGMKIVIDVTVEIKEIAIIEAPVITTVAVTAREVEVTSNFS